MKAMIFTFLAVVIVSISSPALGTALDLETFQTIDDVILNHYSLMGMSIGNEAFQAMTFAEQCSALYRQMDPHGEHPDLYEMIEGALLGVDPIYAGIDLFGRDPIEVDF
jgi:hypothetical protein